jgi:SAM-dependent methyltransferase
MGKEEHDEFAASGRKEQPDKNWMLNAMDLLRGHLVGGETVLDIGCGNGELADLLKKEKQCCVSCLDYAPSHLQRVAAKGYETIRCHLDREEDVAELVKAKQGTYDVVTSLEVIEHLFTPDTLLLLAHRLLKPGGMLVVSTPNMAYASYRLYALMRGNLPAGQGHHVSFYDRVRLWEQLFVCGFDIKEMKLYGGGDFYLDRAIGLSAGPWRRVLLRGLFHAAVKFGNKPLRKSGLIALARKCEAKPLGLSGVVRDGLYTQMNSAERVACIERMWQQIINGRFDSHPDLSNFCLEQRAALHPADSDEERGRPPLPARV